MLVAAASAANPNTIALKPENVFRSWTAHLPDSERKVAILWQSRIIAGMFWQIRVSGVMYDENLCLAAAKL